jgi:hypothetical protein
MQTFLRSILLSAGTVIVAGMALNIEALAQVSDANVRAVNTARNWAINTNGGLSRYEPAGCMFNTGDGGGSCLTQTNNQGFFFSFLGGAPGWQQEGQAPTTETQIEISPDGRTVLNVNYNGVPR